MKINSIFAPPPTKTADTPGVPAFGRMDFVVNDPFTGSKPDAT
jgi:hypothetical protein